MSRRTKLYGRHSVKMGLDSGIQDALKGIESNVKDALRPGAHQGALVVYDEMRLRVPKASGTLHDSIYRKHLENQSNEDRQVYAIGPNKRKAPHWHLIEYGHFQPFKVVNINGNFVTTKQRLKNPKWVNPNSYIRASWDAVKNRAFERAMERIKEIIKERNA